jgi:hypothetical protein
LQPRIAGCEALARPPIIGDAIACPINESSCGDLPCVAARLFTGEFA